MKFDFSQMERNLELLEGYADLAVKQVADESAPMMRSYAVKNRPWDDHTFQARDRLNAEVEPTGKGYRIIVKHGVDYGIWLEMAHNRKYAILQQAVDNVAQTYTMPKFNRIMERINKL